MHTFTDGTLCIHLEAKGFTEISSRTVHGRSIFFEAFILAGKTSDEMLTHSLWEKQMLKTIKPSFKIHVVQNSPYEKLLCV